MEPNTDEKPGLTDQLKQYVETRIKLARLQAIEKGTSFSANLITEFFVMVCIAITLQFATITLALFLGSIMGSYWQGFGVVTVLYLVVAFAIAKTKRKFIEPRIVNFLVKKLLKQRSS